MSRNRILSKITRKRASREMLRNWPFSEGLGRWKMEDDGDLYSRLASRYNLTLIYYKSWKYLVGIDGKSAQCVQRMI